MTRPISENPVNFLRLRDDPGQRRVILQVVDETGNTVSGGNLLSLGYNGRLRLFTGISRQLGLILEGAGQLEINRR